MSEQWMPHVTVASVIERDSKFLLVEEVAHSEIVYNQPAGHLEDNETLIEAVIRETLEETGVHFQPEYLTGIYQWRHSGIDETFLRFCFKGKLVGEEPNAVLDKEIVNVHWFNYQEIVDLSAGLRSPMVLRCIDDYVNGNELPLSILTSL